MVRSISDNKSLPADCKPVGSGGTFRKGATMEWSAFRKHGHQLVDWMVDYLETIRDFPVLAQVNPGDILKQITLEPPQEAESFEDMFDDFRRIILPGLTHWQHPRFFGYFPANSSPPSVLAEMLTATLGAQCMIWQTSPAATELEERMLQWLRQMIGLPREFVGVIQDTASTASLCSILTAREKASDFKVNRSGLYGSPRYAVYGSTETHSSIAKDVKIAGLGQASLRHVPVDAAFALRPDKLSEAIERDSRSGVTPLCVIATLGTTGSTAVDPLREIGLICRRHGVWLHVDAAFAGTALLLPEMRWMSDGIELADTFVFNPHKWMFTNFDCSAYFVKDQQALIRTFEILPEYLKTDEETRVNNYRDWGIQLGRRFRALKLWWVIRTYGVRGLQQRVRRHIDLAQKLAGEIAGTPAFDVLAPVPLNLVCFRFHPEGVDETAVLNRLNEQLLRELNATGALFMTHTKLDGKYTLRWQIGQTYVTQQDVAESWLLVQSIARQLT